MWACEGASVFLLTCNIGLTILPQYCSRACHKTDWKRHKKLCKSDLAKAAWVPRWTRQGRQPTFSFESAQHYHSIPGKKDVRHLWGNTPAMDLLQLRKNEGLPYEQDLEICFAGSLPSTHDQLSTDEQLVAIFEMSLRPWPAVTSRNSWLYTSTTWMKPSPAAMSS